MERYECAACGDPFERPPTRGQRPKWCPACRRPSAKGGLLRGSTKCFVCGVSVSKAPASLARERTVCSSTCRSIVRNGDHLPRRADFERYTARQAAHLDRERRRASGFWGLVEAGNAEGLREWLWADARLRADGECWLWTKHTQDGYPVRQGRLIHRHVYRVLNGPIPVGDHVHHACARRTCLNPDHLRLATARENVAEMLTRGAYEKRLAALDDFARRCVSRLADLDPASALLTEALAYLPEARPEAVA